MYVARLAFTPVKGNRHDTHDSVLLSEAGPLGDRAFCLVDPAIDRCVRTVEAPTLLQARADWDGTTLAVDLPSGTLAGEPVPTGEVRHVDYWGRTASVEIVAGPWAAAYSAHLARGVVLGRCGPGDVVYGAAVTLVTSSSLARLAEAVREPVDAARFRATVELDTGDLPPHAEDGWVGRRLRLGTAEVRVLRPVPRCSVIDHHPVSGERDLALLKALAGHRRADGAVAFGMEAEVTVPGRIRTGDAARLEGVHDG